MVDLPEQFKTRMSAELKNSFGDFLNSYSRPAERAIRVNTLKISVEDFKKISPFSLSPVPWEPCGFYAEEEGLGKTVLHAAGAYYVQEPSAMSVVPQLEIGKNMRVLDLCSAPGGKGTQMAQYMEDGVLVLNEINFPRAKILARNVERLGVKNAVVTCASPEALSRDFAGYFDRILIDAPCSGEGMFKKEPNAIIEWSPQNVSACAVRQRLILAEAAKMLKAGGLMAYSTCTFSREEDEGQIENFLRENPSFRLIKMQKLYPHEARGEGHFYAVLKKDGSPCDEDSVPLYRPAISKRAKDAFFEWAKILSVNFCNLTETDGVLYSLPNGMPATSVQILRAGVPLGEVKNGRFTPFHSLATCLGKNDAPAVEVDGQTALSYLRGLTFPVGCEDGWRLVTHLGLPLGWCKAVGGVAKNHLPKGVRI